TAVRTVGENCQGRSGSSDDSMGGFGSATCVPWRTLARALPRSGCPDHLCRAPAPIWEAASQTTPAPTAQADRRRRLCVVSHSSRLVLLALSPNLPCAP